MRSGDHGVLLLKPEGQIAFASTYFCDLVGVRFDKVAGTSYFDYVFPDDVEIAKTLLGSSEPPHRPPFQFRLKRPDGTPIWVDIQFTAMKGSAGNVYALSAAVVAKAHAAG